MRYNGTSRNVLIFKEINSANLYAVHATSYGAYLVGGDWGIVMRYQDGIWNACQQHQGGICLLWLR